MDAWLKRIKEEYNHVEFCVFSSDNSPTQYRLATAFEYYQGFLFQNKFFSDNKFASLSLYENLIESSAISIACQFMLLLWLKTTAKGNGTGLAVISRVFTEKTAFSKARTKIEILIGLQNGSTSIGASLKIAKKLP